MKKSLLFSTCFTFTRVATLDVFAQAAAVSDKDEKPVVISPLEVRDTAVSGTTLAAIRVELPAGSLANTGSLSEAFAGFHVATSGAHSFNDTIALRGLSNTPIFGAPAVAVYLDEIPLLGAATLPDQLAGLSGASLSADPREPGTTDTPARRACCNSTPQHRLAH